MKMKGYIAVLIVLANVVLISCSGEIDGLAYTMKGEIKMTPKGVSGNEQFITDLVAFYQRKMDNSGTITDTVSTADSIGYDYAALTLKSTTTKDDDAINALKQATDSQKVWIAKLPDGNWHTTFSITYSKYGGSSSGTLSWESYTNMLKGTWTGTTADNKELTFSITDERTDSADYLWANPCTMTYDGKTYTGSLGYTYADSLDTVSSIPYCKVTADMTFPDDYASSTAKLKIITGNNTSTCSATYLNIGGTAIVSDENNKITLTKK